MAVYDMNQEQTSDANKSAMEEIVQWSRSWESFMDEMDKTQRRRGGILG